MIIDITKNWETIQKELLSINRQGLYDLVAYLDKSDFKMAPASAGHHLAVAGGLAEHSLNVLRFARQLNKDLGVKLDDDSLILSALLHDLCKINFYKMGQVWDKEHKDKTNQWRKKDQYLVEDEAPLGHGEKSLALATRYVDLKVDEMCAIRWHMLAWDVSPVQMRTMSGAKDKYPLVSVIAIADQISAFHEDIDKKYETKIMGEEGKKGPEGLFGNQN